MTHVLPRLWSLWFFLLFVGYFLLAFPLYFVCLSIPSRLTQDLAHRLNMLWGYVLTLPVLVFVQPVNREVIDRRQTYVFAPNHISYLDIVICNIGIKNSFRFMGKAELAKLPLFGWMFSRLHIVVPRHSTTGAYRSFLQAKDKLQEGVSVLVYPEATILDKPPGTLGPFKGGAFRLAIDQQVPIVPVTIVGSERVLPHDGKLLLRPGRIKIVFNAPIETVGLTVKDTSALKQKVRDIMLGNLATHHDNSYKI